MSVSASPVRSIPIRTASPGGFWAYAIVGWNLIPSAPLVIVMSSGGRSPASTVWWVPSARTMPSWTVSPAWSRRVRPGLPNPSNGRAVEADDLVADGQSGDRGRAARLDLVDRQDPGRVGEGRDREEDRERQGDVHHHPGDEDDQLPGQRRADERARVVRLAVLALEPDEAADRQPVERVERLALRAEDLRPGREPDPELVDADAGQPGGRRSGRARGSRRARRASARR